ncbi:MAG: peptidylprolyl isomerase [Sulfuricaulis sp.]
MITKLLKNILLVLACLLSPAVVAASPVQSDHPLIRISTSLGVIEVALDAKHAPRTVQNFMHYVATGFYRDTIFHRVIPGFMIQGGGFRHGMKEKPTGRPIRNEADNGLKNLAGTIAMARTSDPDSATAQFFINTVDNPALDHRDKTIAGWGYTVFGKVIRGMNVVHKIEQVSTHTVGPFQDVPVQDVTILKIEILKR